MRLVEAAKASPHAKFYNLSTAYHVSIVRSESCGCLCFIELWNPCFILVKWLSFWFLWNSLDTFSGYKFICHFSFDAWGFFLSRNYSKCILNATSFHIFYSLIISILCFVPFFGTAQLVGLLLFFVWNFCANRISMIPTQEACNYQRLTLELNPNLLKALVSTELLSKLIVIFAAQKYKMTAKFSLYLIDVWRHCKCECQRRFYQFCEFAVPPNCV